MLPLYNFWDFLSAKHIAVIITFAVMFSVIVEVLGTSEKTSLPVAILSTLTVGTLLLLLIFIAYVVYKTSTGIHYSFASMMISTCIILFIVSLAAGIRSALSSSSEFHILQILLSFVASLAVAALFSAFVKIVQKLISP